MMSTIDLTVAGEELTLLPQRAIFWPRQATLLIADPHFGKDATFRAAGIALPRGTLDHDLARLTTVLSATSAARLIVLGDFFHARIGRTPEAMDALAAWRNQHRQLDFVLVRGNHDRHAGPPPAEWQISEAGDCHLFPPFVCCHTPAQPGETDAGYRLAGHLHPVVNLRERGCEPMRLPCFFFGGKEALLPAFGSFTGGHAIQPGAGDRVFAISPAGVHRVR
jgi:DNA ligase-associated metallophosphoesterase